MKMRFQGLSRIRGSVEAGEGDDTKSENSRCRGKKGCQIGLTQTRCFDVYVGWIFSFLVEVRRQLYLGLNW